jgi:hypothetical protein
MADLKVIWRDPTTDVPLKKRIVRELIHEVIADVDATGGEIILMVHWADGVHTELRVPRRRRAFSLPVAQLPLAKDLEDLQLAGTPINETLVREFAGGGFLAQQRNAIGGTGTGNPAKPTWP